MLLPCKLLVSAAEKLPCQQQGPTRLHCVAAVLALAPRAPALGKQEVRLTCAGRVHKSEAHAQLHTHMTVSATGSWKPR